MSTFINFLNNDIEERWRDVDKLLDAAASIERTDTLLHDVLCRSAVLFISAHLESFIKDVAKSAIDDLNTFSNFKSAPDIIKKVYCKSYTNSIVVSPNETRGENQKELEQRTTMLIETLNSFDIKFNIEPFLVNNAYGNNQKNPTPDLISKVFYNFGIRNPFKWLDNSHFNEIFEGSAPNSNQIQQKSLELKQHINDFTTTYPYSIDISLANIQEPTSTTGGVKARSFWETFLDELLKKRHHIAHRGSTDESLSVEVLYNLQSTVTILERQLIMILCHKICR